MAVLTSALFAHAWSMALVVVDLQNDFLHPNGAFPDRHCSIPALLEHIHHLVLEARRRNEVVVWVFSVYGKMELSPAHEGLTHTDRDRPCCVEGSFGSLPAHPVEQWIDRSLDIVIEKNWYSAFRETDLQEQLRLRGVVPAGASTMLTVCGVATNRCVCATAVHGTELGFSVRVPQDAVAGSTLAKHQEGLITMYEAGVAIIAPAAKQS